MYRQALMATLLVASAALLFSTSGCGRMATEAAVSAVLENPAHDLDRYTYPTTKVAAAKKIVDESEKGRDYYVVLNSDNDSKKAAKQDWQKYAGKVAGDYLHDVIKVKATPVDGNTPVQYQVGGIIRLPAH